MPRRLISKFQVRPLFRSRASVFMARNHRFARRNRLTLGDLREEQFIFFNQGSSRRFDYLYKSCAQYGFVPKAPFQISQTSLVFALIAQGFGVTIAPEWAIQVVHAPVSTAQISDSNWSYDLALMWSKTRNSTALTMFLSLTDDPSTGVRMYRG
jgi:DNA-binding transcriptional LysR family regulator